MQKQVYECHMNSVAEQMQCLSAFLATQCSINTNIKPTARGIYTTDTTHTLHTFNGPFPGLPR